MEKIQTPFLQFSRDTWRGFRKDTPLTLTEDELLRLRGQNEPISSREVEDVYLPLSRLINLYVAATQELYKVTTRFLGHPGPKVPYVIGIAGSVAVGKSTVSRVMKALLSCWPDHPRVELVTTDGYLYPTAVLESKGLMKRKGFPESYNLKALIQFLSDLKSGKPSLRVPIYSHYHYDILEEEYQLIDQPDIVIVEGLNVLQIGNPQPEKLPQLFVSDFFDFTIYVDAPTEVIRQWFLDRFMLFRKQASQDPQAFFYKFSQIDAVEALELAKKVWAEINEKNLHQNISPFKQRARLVLEKGEDHSVEQVFLRKI